MTDFKDHLKTGATTVCRAWRIQRSDGMILGFTDHDRDLEFEETVFKAGSALDSAELETHLGLSPDNGAVSGALQDASIREADLLAGLYDEAIASAWLVNWSDAAQRELIFSGYLGQIEIEDGRFHVEMRSHSDRLNRPLGRRYLRSCGTEFGSASCSVDLEDPIFSTMASVLSVDGISVTLQAQSEFSDGWFKKGVLRIAHKSLRIETDVLSASKRIVTVPELRTNALNIGDTVTLIAGCDKTVETCKTKFDNFLNFQGFPFIPGEDSALATPQAGGGN